NVIPAEVSLVCVVKPDDFWDKKVTHFCFWKEKDRLGFEVILVSANKLTRYIEPCQLTEEFGGSLVYDHIDWLNKSLQCRFNGSDGGVSWSPMDDELLAQPQVMKLLDSLREQYTRYQEVCRQRSKLTQLEEIQQKVMQIAALLNAGDEEDLVELKGLQQQLSDVCYQQASQLEFRQNILQSAHEFLGVAQDLSQQLDGLLGMLCADVAPAGGAAIQQTLKHLEEKLKSVGKVILTFYFLMLVQKAKNNHHNGKKKLLN
ncbi:UNVERIFIED_CONTAM: hypothetical protein FKN15_020601, partial [Acipenser sinensis]